MSKKNILLIIETSRAFGRGLLQGISQYLHAHNEWTVHIEDRGLLETTPVWLNQWKGDGVITRTSSQEVNEVLKNLNIPLVELLGNGIDVVPEVRNDETMVAKQVVTHLMQHGFKNLAFFAVGNAWWSQLRQDAFERETRLNHVESHYFPLAGKGLREFYPTWESAYDAKMQNWLRQLPKPVAIWSVSDAWAVRLLEGCRREGISVPNEVAILGTTNDSLLCNILSPALSSIDLNSPQIGLLAAERLENKMNGKSVEEAPLLVEPNGVVERASTDTMILSDDRIASAMQFIQNKATSNLTIDKIADFVNMSRSTLQRKFRRAVGRTIENEITRVRMEIAKRMLRETRFPLAIVADKTGYGTVEYFVHAFKRENGTTPNQYRLLFQKFHS